MNWIIRMKLVRFPWRRQAQYQIDHYEICETNKLYHINPGRTYQCEWDLKFGTNKKYRFYHKMLLPWTI